jgi:flagella basal body P-ring formation protein FlgA
LDPRLRLKQCGEPLDAFPTGTRRFIGATTVGVRCGGPNPWSLYVSARVAVQESVLVAARPLARGETLGTADVRLVERDLSNLHHGYFEKPGQAVGKVLKQRVSEGDVIRPTQLTEPKMVHRGQRVVLTAEAAGLQVRMAGKALADGATGDWIKVQNLSSNRIVEGEVIAAGVVKIKL